MLRQSGDFFLTGHVSGSFKGEGRKPKEGGVGGGVGEGVGGGGGGVEQIRYNCSSTVGHKKGNNLKTF